VPCGRANTVCAASTVCTQSADCIPPCTDSTGAAIYRPITTGTCETNGLITAADGRCLVPCWSTACGVLGGVSC
jgi:hypothetical protein